MTPDPRPLPPGDLHRRNLRLAVIPPGTDLHRFYPIAKQPIHFDRSRDGRLNAPDGEYGVLYVARTRSGAFAETFLRRPGRTLLPKELVDAKSCARLRTLRDLTLVQMHGAGLGVMGATAEVTSARGPYELPQAWSAAIHGHPLGADGIAYRARHDDDQICYAIFERAADGVGEIDRERDLDADWFYDLMNVYDVGLVPD